MKLKPVRNDTAGALWCAPTAICRLTGIRASRVLDAIRDAWYPHGWKACGRRQTPVHGVTTGTVCSVLSRFGYRAERVWPDPSAWYRHPDVKQAMTIDRWHKELRLRPDLKGRAFYIATRPTYGHNGRHAVVLANGLVGDGGMVDMVRDYRGRNDPVAEIVAVSRSPRLT